MKRSSGRQRSLDFVVGVPLLRAIGAVRRRRAAPRMPARIGVIVPTAIGDLILSVGVLLRIREVFPDAEIHLFHGASNAGVVSLLPMTVVSHQCIFQAVKRTLGVFRQCALDMCIDITPWARLTALYAVASGAFTVGFSTQRQFRHYAFDSVVPHLNSRHEIANLAALADVFAQKEVYSVKLAVPSEVPWLGFEWGKCILMHTCPGGTRAREKSWPVLYWAQLTRKLVDDGWLVAFSGSGPDGAVIEEILRNFRGERSRVISLCNRLSIAGLASALRACRACVSVDTGVMHLASAVGTPLVALFGPSHSSRWGAVSRSAVNLDAPHLAGGFVSLGFEQCGAGMEVMRSLGVESVYDTLRDVIQRTVLGPQLGNVGGAEVVEAVMQCDGRILTEVRWIRDGRGRWGEDSEKVELK